MPTPAIPGQDEPRPAYLLRIFEPTLVFLVVLVLALGWFVAIRYQVTVRQAVTRAYQETQLEIVRAVSRSVASYVRYELERGRSIEKIEQEIFRRFVEPVRLLANGDAWIYAPDHVVFDLSSDFPEEYRGKSMAEIFAFQARNGARHYEEMCRNVTDAAEGVGWYVWLPEKGPEIAAWTPVRFGPHVWTIGLSTPLSEILEATGARRQTRFILTVMSAASLLGFCMTGLALWSMFRRRQMDARLRCSHAELALSVEDLRREIEKRRRTENDLQEINRRLNALIEAIPDPIYFKDIQGRNLVVNRAFAELAGLPMEKILGLTDGELFPIDLAETCRRSDAESLMRRIPCRFEEQVAGRSGDTVYFDTYKAPLFDAEGHITGLVGISRDVTPQKQAEKERRRLNEQLMQAQKMDAIGTLAGGVAHDLNNILAGLVSYPELLLMTLEPDSPLRNPMETILRSGERAAAIVQDLLALSRRGHASMEVLELNRIIGEYLTSPEHGRLMLEHPGIKVETALQKELLPIKGVAVSLTKTLMNLVINAFESMQGTEGRLSIATENCYVDRRLKGTSDVTEGDYVRLTVADNGRGVPEADHARIFEPFYTRKVLGRSGTGLGLSVVWGVVQEHRGFIHLHSREGAGARFEVYLPVTRECLPGRETPAPPETYRGNGETILVVDDVELQREVASHMITRLGYRVDSVSSGEAAVAYIERQPVDLVVLDMIMDPGMDGLETYRRILELRPGQKAIVTSGFTESERVNEILRLGAGAYLRKPYLLEKIGLAIRRELDS
ncbi:MAG: ATP-binding protein [Thermodesulfobacteriota bacterium]